MNGMEGVNNRGNAVYPREGEGHGVQIEGL